MLLVKSEVKMIYLTLPAHPTRRSHALRATHCEPAIGATPSARSFRNNLVYHVPGGVNVVQMAEMAELVDHNVQVSIVPEKMYDKLQDT